MLYTWQVITLLWCIWIPGFLPLATAQAVFPNTVNSFPAPQVWLLAKTSLDSTSTLRLAVQMPAEHHGYLDTGDEGFYIPLSFSFPALETRGVHMILRTRPQGTRDEIVHATVLRGYGEFVFQVEGQTTEPQTNSPLGVLFRYQICNDVTKICYPPQELGLQLSSVQGLGDHTATVITPGRENGPPKGTLTANERLYVLFKNYESHAVLAFLLVSVAGLLASATPCVYPMLSITATIFTARGQGSWRRGQLHALVFCSGLITFYALLGLLATTTGTALSAIMTNAWVQVAFAGIFAYFGLSMLGLYEFQFLPALMTRLDTLSSQWKGVTGTLCMGATTGLIVSPCVGPITGSILLDIANQVASTDGTMLSTHTTAWLLRGTFLMSGFGLGLSLPFLCIGLLSSRIPQSGRWLTKTKYLLAVPTFYFSYSYYIKGMEIAAVPRHTAHDILLGLLAIVGAVTLTTFHRRREHSSTVLLMQRGLAMIFLMVGLLALYKGVGQSNFLHTLLFRQSSSAQQTAVTDTAIELHANLRWLRGFAFAQQQARIEQKPLFVDFYALWCANCKAFQQLTQNDPQLNTALQDVVLAKIYDTDPVFRILQQEPHYPELRGIGGQPLLPLFAIYSSRGALIWKGQDYQAISTMIAQLDYAKGLTTP